MWKWLIFHQSTTFTSGLVACSAYQAAWNKSVGNFSNQLTKVHQAEYNWTRSRSTSDSISLYSHGIDLLWWSLTCHHFFMPLIIEKYITDIHLNAWAFMLLDSDVLHLNPWAYTPTLSYIHPICVSMHMFYFHQFMAQLTTLYNWTRLILHRGTSKSMNWHT